MTWRVLFPAGPASDVREAFERWLVACEDARVDDQRIRFDLIRSDRGDLLRVLINMDQFGEDGKSKFVE